MITENLKPMQGDVESWDPYQTIDEIHEIRFENRAQAVHGKWVKIVLLKGAQSLPIFQTLNTNKHENI